MNITLKRLLFYWTTSFILTTTLYYILRIVIPELFGLLYRMYAYHWTHPIPFIIIPCFFYGIIATIFTDRFSGQSRKKQTLLTITIIALTILVSSPFGGMLWHYYDMNAGYFPENWVWKMIKYGFYDGLPWGWLVIAFSIPYNIIGSIICYFLTKKGSEFFKTEHREKVPRCN